MVEPSNAILVKHSILVTPILKATRKFMNYIKVFNLNYFNQTIGKETEVISFKLVVAVKSTNVYT